MKKILTLLLTLLLFITLVGCNSSNDQSTIVDEPEKQEEVVEPKEDEPIVGGFVDVEDRTITDELKEIFNKAKEGYVGISLEPVELYQTQVVAGTNYKFVCSGTKTTNPPIKGTYFVTVYKDLQGNCSIIDVETVTESSGDVDGDTTVKEVDKSMNYWVVFYNPDGLELDRQAIKYGTIPTYKGEDPYYWDNDYWYRFICWTDKQGNEIKEFTPITGNTYIYAKYEIGGKAKKEESIDVEKLPLYYFAFGEVDWAYSLFEYNQTSQKFEQVSNTYTSDDPGVSEGWYHKLGNQYIPCAESALPEPHGFQSSMPTPP